MQRTNFKMEYENITMTAGDTVAFNVIMTDFEGDPITVDSASFKVMSTSSRTQFEKTIGNGITQEAGLMTVRVAPIDTRTKPAGEYFYKFTVTVNNDVFTVKRGLFTIEADAKY